MRVIEEKKPLRPMSPIRIICGSFALIILTGTLLLMLPMASKDGQSLPFITSLFTATSCTCVTGLTLVDPWVQFTFFGQLVMTILIQVGGIGLVTITTFFFLAMGKKLGFRNMVLAQENASTNSIKGIRELIFLIMKTTAIIEGAGALLLAIRFVPKFGASGIWTSIFTSISAYCNAGFDILGREHPFGSLMYYNDDPIVMYTVMALIVLGGIGFIVIQDLLKHRPHQPLTLHTRVVLIMTATLIFGGALAFFLLENNGVMAGWPVGDKITASFFQSITPRTAGFVSVDMVNLTGFSKLLLVALMFIGAAPGSTGGGIKVTTFAILFMTVLAVIRGREDTVILRKKVDKKTVYRSLAITALGLLVMITTTLIIELTSKDVPIINALVEAASAFGTVGLTAGTTLSLTLVGKLAVILTMFIGRVGPVSFFISLSTRPESDTASQILPEGKIMAG